MATITEHRNLMEDSLAYVVNINDILNLHGPEVIFHKIASLVAEKYVAEHYQDIAALISPEAIATLSAAEAAAKIRETLEKKIPDKILEITKTNHEVWQRGLLGGMRRIG